MELKNESRSKSTLVWKLVQVYRTLVEVSGSRPWNQWKYPYWKYPLGSLIPPGHDPDWQPVPTWWWWNIMSPPQEPPEAENGKHEP